MLKSLVSSAIVLLILSTSCAKKKENKTTNVVSEILTPKLELLWETDTLLTTCESVLYDASTQTIYVANINSGPWVKDNNGFISTINTNGNITDLKWAEGLSGPKGMGILNGKLYVNDIDRVVEIDIATKNISNSYNVEGEPQLNDITVSKNAVFASGSNSDAIYKVENNSIVEVAKDSLGRLNGLLHQEEGIYYATSGTQNFGIYNKKDKTFKTLTSGVGHGDGVVRLENGDFIVSGWKGEVFYIQSKDWTKTKLLDTREQAIYAADIDYIPATQTLLVPTFFHNRVMAYKLKFE